MTFIPKSNKVVKEVGQWVRVYVCMHVDCVWCEDKPEREEYKIFNRHRWTQITEADKRAEKFVACLIYDPAGCPAGCPQKRATSRV